MNIVLSTESGGDVRISGKVVGDIVKAVAGPVPGIKKVKKVEASLYEGRMIVNLMIICKKGCFVKDLMEGLQNSVNNQIKKQLGMAVLRVNVTIDRFV